MRPALRHWAPLILAVAGAALYLLIRPASADLAAHLYRAGLFRRQGFAVWDGAWYGGHHLPGYSVLFPPFEAFLRPRLAGAVATVAAAALFAALARGHWGERGALAAAWFGAGSVTLLLTGRLAFAAGVAAALLALLVWERRGLGAGVAGALLTGLTSPVAALFLAAGALAGRRPRLLAALVLPLLVWQFANAVRDVRVARDDPSTRASYYTGVVAFLERAERTGGPARVEVPFTRLHWEAALVAPHVPLARGWERQLDGKYDAVFSRPLTQASYRAWLASLAVRFVALPDVRLDYTATAEARLLRAGVPWLRPVYRDAHWRVWEVRGAAPLASGAARATALDNDDVRLLATRPGHVHVRVRYSPYWALAAGRGCVSKSPGGFTDLTLRAAGPVRLVTRFDPLRGLTSGPRCR